MIGPKICGNPTWQVLKNHNDVLAHFFPNSKLLSRENYSVLHEQINGYEKAKRKNGVNDLNRLMFSHPLRIARH